MPQLKNDVTTKVNKYFHFHLGMSQIDVNYWKNTEKDQDIPSIPKHFNLLPSSVGSHLLIISRQCSLPTLESCFIKN